MVRWLRNLFRGQKDLDSLLSDLITTQDELRNLPQFSDLERAKFEHELALDHLYYSSKIEGTALSKRQIDKAVYGGAYSAGE